MVYGLKNSFQNETSCSEERCDKKGSSMNESHAKVQSQGRTHSEKATQKSQRLATSTNCVHWIQEGVSKTRGFKSAYLLGPYKPYTVTLLTR